jgi:hypothetical protein
MGTSSSYGGPMGKNPLLPDDFEDANNPSGSPEEGDTPSNGPNDQQTPPAEEVDVNQNTDLWKNAKTQVSRLIKDSSRSTGNALSSYVKAHGGSSRAAATAVSGKLTTTRLGGFLSNISSQGIQNTLTEYKIKFEGRSTEEVLSELINKIAPVPETKEDSIARNALSDAIEVLYEDVNENGGDIEILDNLDEDTFNDIMRTYISSYIFQRFLSDLESRFEAYSQDSTSALDLEKEIKEYISGVVDNKLKAENFSNFDYSSDSVSNTIDEVYADCYDVIEGAI